MKFIALIVALLFIQHWGSAQRMHRDEWYDFSLEKLRSLALPAPLQLALAILAPTLLVFWLLNLAGSWGFGLPALALNIAILLYSFGRGNYEEAMSAYRKHCRAGDFEAAYLLAGKLFPRRDGDTGPDDAEESHRWMRKRLLYMGFERWFAVIFYFALFGAAGALAYRLCQLSEARSGGEKTPGSRTLHVLDWAPARLLAFSFTLTGDYLGGRGKLISALQDFAIPNEEVLAEVACAALGTQSWEDSEGGVAGVQAQAEAYNREMQHLHSMMSRSAVAWVFLLALLVVLV